MQLKLGYMKKRINSTKYIFEEKKTVDAKLKEPTNIKSPTFLLLRSTGDVDKVNYLSCQWGYYYVDDVVYVTHDLVELHCHRDALATAYNLIQQQEAFVTYGDNDLERTGLHNLDDQRLQPDVLQSEGEEIFRGSHFATTGDDCAIIFTFCGIGFGTTSIIIDYSEYQNIVKTFMGTQGGISTLDEATERFLGTSWKDCIISAILTPFSKTWLEGIHTTPVSEIVVGSVNITLNNAAHIIGADIPTTVEKRATLNLPLSYQQYKNNLRFLYGKKYFNVQVHTSAGSFDISTDDFIHNNKIVVEEKIFPISGSHTIEIYVDNGDVGSAVRGTCLACIRENLGLDVTGMLHGYSMHDTNLAYFQGAARLLYATDDALKTLDETKIFKNFSGPKIQMASASMGGANGFGDYDLNSYKIVTQLAVPRQLLMYTTTSANPYTDYAKLHGYAINQMMKIGNLNGYCECAGASFDPSVTATYTHYPLFPSEIAEINGHMNSGFFIE